ncbi:SEN34 subunit of tRNA-splicing endonuclease [Aspergillus steynii IBT 23096]|uniref:tRNA-splicing endonuclease subunit Sen34 n=1 Tax=Aspergillus steynii IBT 23096 TaxID=1392250 RepID=A0A2I2G2V0_9EURO|nr:SEN34 subunit of tRNA-splicing endonuclease [Aspergillus steynii IBT 23096]PLB47202.1 SEN34 subunit of tRNA-splicing endonuclease [Aspergillus steynii IBT 23096]
MNSEPSLPIPISYIAGKYFLFSIDAVTYLRREHHVCGVLSGTLPQIPQQNIFLGLPLELMPEEARLLVEKGVACIVDEVNAQRHGMKALMEADRQKYLHDLESQGLQAMQLQNSRKEQQKEKSLQKIAAKKAKKAAEKQSGDKTEEPIVDFFADNQKSESSETASISATSDPALGITPATSVSLLPSQPAAEHLMPLPEVPSSYPLFAHLHSEGYFLSPGLRFGCQYLAYPGDSLRFHSHFLVVSTEWDQELDLMDLVAGGRLGTGVKKGFLIGGAEKDETGEGEKVRTFSLEWAGM